MFWSIRPILDEPEVILLAWSVFEVPLLGEQQPWTRHFVGFSDEVLTGQSSAVVVAFDPIRKLGLTQSGRVYRLEGGPGLNPEGLQLWRRWKALSRVEHERDVTDEVLEAMVAWPVGCPP